MNMPNTKIDKTNYQAELFANRLRRKYKELRKQMRKNRVSCYRLYDRDIPEVMTVILLSPDPWYSNILVGAVRVAHNERALYIKPSVNPFGVFACSVADEPPGVLPGLPACEVIFISVRIDTVKTGEHPLVAASYNIADDDILPGRIGFVAILYDHIAFGWHAFSVNDSLGQEDIVQAYLVHPGPVVPKLDIRRVEDLAHGEVADLEEVCDRSLLLVEVAVVPFCGVHDLRALDGCGRYDLPASDVGDLVRDKGVDPHLFSYDEPVELKDGISVFFGLIIWHGSWRCSPIHIEAPSPATDISLAEGFACHLAGELGGRYRRIGLTGLLQEQRFSHTAHDRFDIGRPGISSAYSLD